MSRPRLPFTVGGVVLLGALSMAGGVFLILKECSASEECINTTLGGVLAGFGAVAFLSLIPNMVGLVACLSAVGFSIFLGLVFVFAREPAGFLPPLLLAGLTWVEHDLLRRYYAPEHASPGTDAT